MNQGTKIAWDDTVLPFQLDASDIRGRVARLDGVLEGILRQHDYPEKVEALVAEMACRVDWPNDQIEVEIAVAGPVKWPRAHDRC